MISVCVLECTYVLTVGRILNTTPEPTVPSPIANAAILTGGSSKPKYAFMMYGCTAKFTLTLRGTHICGIT